MKCGEGRLALLGNLNGIEQKVSHQEEPCGLGCSVSGPMLGRGVFDRLIEHRLEGTNTAWWASANFLRRPDTCRTRETTFRSPPALQHEGFADNQLYFGKGFFRSFEQSVQVFLVGFDRSVVTAV